MQHPDLGDYRTENHVIAFEPDRLIVWTTARVGNTPPGFYWSWALEPLDDGRTKVSHIYDWEDVTDEAVLARVSFPRVPARAMNATVTRLAEVAAGS
jgi:hypothetical protein